jgi:PGF-CTERM protein
VTAVQGDDTTATPSPTPTATPSPTETDGTVPGFTVTAALLAVVVTFVLIRRRR